jgi:hypothetical protein
LFGVCLNSGILPSIDLWPGQDLTVVNLEISVETHTALLIVVGWQEELFPYRTLKQHINDKNYFHSR